MGVYLVLYFVFLAIALVTFYIAKKSENEIFNNVAIISMLLMIFFLIFALFTNDPIEELLTTIPAFWQFMITASGGAFTIWKVYLNPLKNKVYSMDKELGGVKIIIDRVENELKNGLNRVEKNLDKLIDNPKKASHK